MEKKTLGSALGHVEPSRLTSTESTGLLMYKVLGLSPKPYTLDSCWCRNVCMHLFAVKVSCCQCAYVDSSILDGDWWLTYTSITIPVQGISLYTYINNDNT